MFCAPSPIHEPLSASATTAKAVKGGHTTTSDSTGSARSARRRWTRATAWAVVWYIFQFPAINGVRITREPTTDYREVRCLVVSDWWLVETTGASTEASMVSSAERPPGQQPLASVPADIG